MAGGEAELALRRLREHQAVFRALEGQAEELAAAARLLLTACRNRRQIFFFGNGGSAADAQHLAAELSGRFLFDRPALPAQALTANGSAVTAIGNDYGFERIFARQLEACGRRGDAAVGLSTSGRSKNVAEGLRAARRLGLVTLALTGATPGPVGRAAQRCLRAPSAATPRIQEAHIFIGHVLCEIVEAELFGGRHEKY